MNLELNQFRNVDVVLDKANDNFIQKQFVSAGDKDGRSLTVQITENGAVGEVIGLTLNLRWHNEASGLTDLSAFYVVDRATSVFKIDYPQNMLTPGKVVAYIQILHGGKVTHTKPFEITVQNLAGTTKGVLATAEYGALVTTLAKANEFETEIAKKASKAELSGVASPLAVSLAAQMTDVARIYVYTGVEGGYAAGNWYYHNGAAWVSGGVYQASGIGNDSVKMSNLKNNVANDLYSWGTLKFNGLEATLTGSGNNMAFQSKITGRSIVISGVSSYTYTLTNAECLILNWDTDKDIATNSSSVFSTKTLSGIKASGGLLRTEHLILGSNGGKHFSGVESFETIITDEFYSNLKLSNNNISVWYDVVFEKTTYTLKFGKKPVFQNNVNGLFLYFINDDVMDYTLNDGQKLILKWDGKTSVNPAVKGTHIKMVPVSTTLASDEIAIASRVGNVVTSPIPSIQQAIYKASVHSVSLVGDVEPLAVSDKIKNIAPVFYKKWKKQSEDMAIVMVGDSISTTNYYATPHVDAKNRPPLMVENSYSTYIEEQLRWSGQKYYRYDTGVFTEVSSTAVTKEYDMAWDWITTTEDELSPKNNRPALTRILEGTNVSVSYTVPLNVRRCDFIYRTDYLNSPNAVVSVSGGNGVLQVFNETTQTWVEANGYSYSAKEDGTVIPGVSGSLKKSIYQKRLKMKVVGVLSSTVVTITNNGSGRLTYWGIQTGKSEHMVDFILSARGGHQIARLECFEEWDVDYYKPQLILWQVPLINENMNVANSSFVPNNMGANNKNAFAQRILDKALDFKAKEYSPELMTMTMWFGKGNNAMNQNNEWVYGYCDDGSYVSVPEYVRTTDGLLTENNIRNISVFEYMYDYAKKWTTKEGVSIPDLTLTASGVTSYTWSNDGGHFNDNGTSVVNSIISPLFVC